jgi:putative NIF3 family GTP cyclohydrolase 1 type 2
MAGTLAVARIPLYGAAGPAAQDIVKQIQDRLSGDWQQTGLDGFKAGDPQAEVRGIATTAMATMEVLQQASKTGRNLIITHEPTFFGIRDGAPPPAAPGGRGGGFGGGGVAADDPVYKAKREFIEKNNMVVFRLRDHWQTRKENDRVVGLADSLGWSKHMVPGETMMFDIPSATVEETVALIRKKLNLRGGLRAVGDPKAKVRRVMLYPGMMTPDIMLKYFGQVDLLIAGEVREWECTTYAGDMNSAGEKRSLVTIGRVASEDPGMRVCATWLKTFVKGVPVEWISAGDPFWRQS